VIQRFANGDAVEPRFQRAALAEIANAAKGFQKDFLGAVGGIGSVAQHAEDQVIDRRMIVRDEPVEGRLRAGLQLVDEFGFIAAPRKALANRTLPAFPTRLLEASHPADRSNNALYTRTLDLGLLASALVSTSDLRRERRWTVPDVRSLFLDTGRAELFPRIVRNLVPLGIVAPKGLFRNGRMGQLGQTASPVPPVP